MKLPVSVCRAGYRAAYTALRGYWFIARPEVQGVKCVLTDRGRVLLVRHTYGDRAWDLPGGAVRRAEDPSHTATREMQEELGVEVPNWTVLGEVRGWIHHRADNMHCFQAEVGDHPITMDPCELAAVRWFPRGQLPDDLGRFVKRILALVGDQVEQRP